MVSGEFEESRASPPAGDLSHLWVAFSVVVRGGGGGVNPSPSLPSPPPRSLTRVKRLAKGSRNVCIQHGSLVFTKSTECIDLVQVLMAFHPMVPTNDA